MIEEAIAYAKAQGGSTEEQVENAADKLAVAVGLGDFKPYSWTYFDRG